MQMNRIVEVARWEPHGSLPELPLGALNLTWNAEEGRLVCVGLYSSNSKRPAEGIVVEFNEVHAFKVLDEMSNGLCEMGAEPPPLREPATYGGVWPFAEILLSPWIIQMAESDGSLNITHLRHWVVITPSQTLHVAAHFESEPHFTGWFNPARA